MFKKNFKGMILTVLIVCSSFYSYKKINAMEFDCERGNFCCVIDHNEDYENIFNEYLKYLKKKLEYKTKEIINIGGYILKVSDEVYDMNFNNAKDFLKSVDIFDVIPITKKEYKMVFGKVKKTKEDKTQKIYQPDPRYNKNRMSIDLDIFRKIIKKIMREFKTEKDKLFLFYVCFYELFKIFKSNFFEIIKVINLYTKKTIDFVNNLESTPNAEDKGNIKKKFYDRLGIKKKGNLNFYVNRGDKSAFYLECREYDDDDDDLCVCIKDMLKCLKLMDEMYEELLKFKNNIKDNTLFDLKFVKNRRIIKKISIAKGEILNLIKNKEAKKAGIRMGHEMLGILYEGGYDITEKCLFELKVGFDLTDNIKYEEELLNLKNDVEDLTKYLNEIIKFLNLKDKNIYSYYKNFIDKYNRKDIFSSSVLDNIKKEIELRKELMQIIKEIIRKDIYKNIVNKIMG